MNQTNQQQNLYNNNLNSNNTNNLNYIDNRIISFFSEPINNKLISLNTKENSISSKNVDLKNINLISKPTNLERRIIPVNLIKLSKSKKIFTKYKIFLTKLNTNLQNNSHLNDKIYHYNKIFTKVNKKLNY